MAGFEFHVYLPQVRMGLDAMVERARAAETAGFTGMALMDHLMPPGALDQPMYEAMVSATWLAARTQRLVLGHLVLCDAFRHPAVLAREAVTLDHASGGRFELGLGWGSVPSELATFGIADISPRSRVERLAETLEVLQALWSGDMVEYRGTVHTVERGLQLPTPTRSIPIVIGGTGRRTMELVAKHADWWNVQLNKLDQLDALRDKAGRARVSIQQMVAYVPSESQREGVTTLATRRFAMYGDGLVIGDANQLIDHFGALADRGVERCYTWFADFAAPDTLAAFGRDVLARFAAGIPS